MAARLFQSILLEVKDNVDFILGVVDNTGVITACTELKFIGESIEAAVEFFKMGLEEGQAGGYTFHMIGGYEAGAENAVFARQHRRAGHFGVRPHCGGHQEQQDPVR